jgi:glucose/arabinose dehydrogenase
MFPCRVRSLLPGFLLAMTLPAMALARHGGPGIRLERVADGLVAPMQLTAPEDGTGRRFVVDQVGTVRILTREGRLLPEPFLDVTAQIVELEDQYDERGLLGLAFHTRFAENGRFYVYFTVPPQRGMPDSTDHANRLVEFRVSADDPGRADPRSGRVLAATTAGT